MYNNFVVEGEKIALELLTTANFEIEAVIATEDWLEKQRKILRPYQHKILVAKPKEMDQLTLLKTATEVFIVAKQVVFEPNDEPFQEKLSLYLETIQNPGNFGTILRIADWFGISTVYCSMDSADLYNPKVIQATMGAFLRVNVRKIEFDQLQEHLEDIPIYGTVLGGKNIFETPLSEHGIIVIGNEGKGISEKLKQQLTHPITIPAHGDGGAESLNAAVATGIVCAAFRNFK